MNKLFFGDNLEILKEHFEENTVDLIYLDPPFNSKTNYNVLFKAPSGADSQAQIEAFDDTWHWNASAEQAFDQVMEYGHTAAFDMLSSIRSSLGENDMTAYLTMMAVRLLELHRVLKDTGSIFLHCDSSAVHYLKIIMDSIFGPQNYRNDLIWKRANTVKGNFGQGQKSFDRNTDNILFYSKSENNTFCQPFKPYSADYIEKSYRHVDEDGRRYQSISMTGPGGKAKGNPYYEVMGVSRYWRYSEEKMQELIDSGMVVQTKVGNVPRKKQYLDGGKGVPVQSLWDDVEALHSQSAERLGYPTQKPLALLERIIESAAPEGGVVLDPFCGCGTAIHAAQTLGRQWIGIDITHLAITLIEKRIREAFPDLEYTVEGSPVTVEGAAELADRDKYQFEWWALSLIGAMPFKGKKKGADGGIDGIVYFRPDGAKSKPKKAIVSVKGGQKVGVAMIRDLIGTVENDRDAEIGIFICLAEPTAPMIKEAARSGFYKTANWGNVPKIQVFTIDDLLNKGKTPQIPAIDAAMFRKSQKEIDQKQADIFTAE